MTQGDFVKFPRRRLLHFLSQRLYHQKNINKIANGDDLIVPVQNFKDFIYDIGIVLGKSIADVIEELIVQEDEEDEKENQG